MLNKFELQKVPISFVPDIKKGSFYHIFCSCYLYLSIVMLQWWPKVLHKKARWFWSMVIDKDDDWKERWLTRAMIEKYSDGQGRRLKSTVIIKNYDWKAWWLTRTKIEKYGDWQGRWLKSTVIDKNDDWKVWRLTRTIIEKFADWQARWLKSMVIDKYNEWLS